MQEPTPIYEEYPDMRYHEQEEMAQSEKSGFKILSTNIFQGNSGEYKQVLLQDETGAQHTALAFPTLGFIYEELNAGNYTDKICIKQKGSSYIIGNYSEWRNYKNKSDTAFIMSDGDVYKK